MKSPHRWLLLLLLLASPGLLPAQNTPKTRQIGPYTLKSEASHLAPISQGMTGSCWSFATTSFLESEVQRINGFKVDLSEIFEVRNAVREKARRYVRLEGKAQFGQGGLAHDVVAMVRRYGAMPEKLYSGLHPGERVHNHAELFALLDVIMKKLVKDGPKKRSPHWLEGVMGLVDGFLGRPPASIPTKQGPVSPVAYATKVLHLPLNDYVEVMSYSYTPFHKPGELLVPDNWMRFQGYLNLPIDEFMADMNRALMQGFTVAVDMDVSEPGFRARAGQATLPARLEKKGAITQHMRDVMFDRGLTTDDHLMHVVGLATGPDGRNWYYTKNSWGQGGTYHGFLFVSENFMRAKALSYMVHKDGLRPQPSRDN